MHQLLIVVHLLAAALLTHAGDGGLGQFHPARIISRDELSAAISRGESVAAWGSALLTDALPSDSSPKALVALRVAARRVRAAMGSAPVEFDDTFTSVSSARIAYSVDGSSVSPVSVARSEGDAGGPLGWEEHPVLGRVFWVRLRARRHNATDTTAPVTEDERSWVAHSLELTSGVPDGDINVLAHTWDSILPNLVVQGEHHDESLGEGKEGEKTDTATTSTLRTLCYNVWNSNPPKWLFRDPRDRFRQYALRMLHLGENVRGAAAGIVAFQEVRYDSSLGGFDGGNGGPWGEGKREGPGIVVANAEVEDASASASASASAAAAAVVAAVALEAAPPAHLAHAHMPEIGRQVPYSFNMGFAVASLWLNKTAEFSQSDKYRGRNEARWENVIKAAGWQVYGGSLHPSEGDDDVGVVADVNINVNSAAGIRVAVAAAGEAGVLQDGATSADADASAAVPVEVPTPLKRGRSPFLKPQTKGPANWRLLQESFLDHPHAQVRLICVVRERKAPRRFAPAHSALTFCSPPLPQIEHLSTILPGYQYVHVPAQMYLDKSVWGVAEGPGRGSVQRDEEGPAIFSKWPILYSESLLLSRDASDEGDGHQRACLHAVIDATATISAAARARGESLVVDVYTAHLSLSEAARNRTVPEILAFVSRSARGKLTLLMGDLNAEPHEPAMRALVAAGVILVPTAAAAEQVPPAPQEDAGAGTGASLALAVDDAAAALVDVDVSATLAITNTIPKAMATATPTPAVRDIARSLGGVLLGPVTPLRIFEMGHHGGFGGFPGGFTAGVESEVVSESAIVPDLVFPSPSSSSQSQPQPQPQPQPHPLLCDTWRALHAEPPPRDADAAARRFAFTFPADDPVKRIDLVTAGCGDAVRAPKGDVAAAAVAAAAAAHCAALEACAVRVGRSWLVGQDPVPGTDVEEGRNVGGMVGERSPIWASDHRGVVVEFINL